MAGRALGKGPAETDERTIELRQLYRGAPSLPESYDFDESNPGVVFDNPMFANDRLGNCVIAERAHHTRRMEYKELTELITITEEEVTKQYFTETRGDDTGLILLRSLRNWRNRGWVAAGNNLFIKGFAKANPLSPEEVKAVIYADVGLDIGISMPNNWEEALDQGKPWSDISMNPNSRNGHCVFIKGYNSTYLTCVTWGQEQFMTWPWFQKYCDEAYAIFDAINTDKRRQLFDLDLFDRLADKWESRKEKREEKDEPPVAAQTPTHPPSLATGKEEGKTLYEIFREDFGEKKTEETEEDADEEADTDAEEEEADRKVANAPRPAVKRAKRKKK